MVALNSVVSTIGVIGCGWREKEQMGESVCREEGL